MVHAELPPAVVWRNVSKVYPGHEALRGVSLEAAQGEFLAILGTSGSGKTTMLKMVNRLIDPTDGEVVVEGRPTADWDPIALRRSTGYVIQEVGLMPHMTIMANVAIVPRLLGIPRDECRARASHRLQIVGLDPERFGSLMPHQLSGGQRQRVGVARALAADPALLLMDEPFGALDPITRREIQFEFRSLQKRLAKTIIFVTHDLREACRIADRLVLMDRGHIVQQGPPIEFLERPANEFVRAFFQDAGSVVEAVEGGAA